MIPVKKIRILFVFIVILLIYCFSTLMPFVSMKVQPPQISVQNNEITGNTVILWNEVDDAYSYNIYRSTEEEGKYTLLETTTDTTFTDSSTKADREYFYYVVSVDDEGDLSEHSNTASIVRPIAKPEITLSNDSSTGKVMISWEAVDGAKEYDIYRSQTADGEYTLITTTTATSAFDSDMTLGQRFCYKIVARGTNPAADSVFSAAKSRACILATPDVKLENVASTGKIRLRWNAVEGAKKYRIYRSSTQTNGYTLLTETSKTTVTNTTISVGDTYFYRVVAVAQNTADNSGFSPAKNATCTLPNTVLTLSNIDETGKIKVSWKKVKGARGYEIWRADSKDGDYQLVATESSTSYTDTDSKACSTYYYKVKAVDKNPLADSMFSAVQSAYCKLASTALTLSVNNSGQAVIEWDKVSDAKEYQLYRSTTGKTGSYKLFTTTQETKLVNPQAEIGNIYYYRVRAVSDEKKYNSVFSDADCVYVDSDGAYLPSYVLLPSVTLYPDMNDLTQTVTAIYMEPVYTGKFYSDSTGGKWIMAKYNGKTYYTFLNDTLPTYTRTQSSFDYESKDNTDLQNQIVSLASKYAFEPTFYAHKMSDGKLDEATGKYGFDCSGLVAYVFNTIIQQENPLYSLSRSITAQYNYNILYNKGYNNQFAVIDVEREDMQPGDIIFFKVNHSDSREIDHCGIYLGNNEFVHATSRFNNGVCIMPLDYVFNSEFRCVKRFAPKEILPADQIIQTTKSTVHIYSEKSVSSDILHTFKKGENATLLYTNAAGSWGYIRSEDGTTGFVQMKNFKVAE